MSDLFTYLSDLFAFDNSHPLLFTQFNFWAFFLLVYALFCLVIGIGDKRRGNTMSRGRRLMRNGYLFLVSLFFYYKTSGLFVLLLIFSTFLGWILGIRMDALLAQGEEQTKGRRKALMIGGVVVNLAVLFYFKYAYFFCDLTNTICNTRFEVVNLLARWSNHFTATSHFDASVILLPVGISFFTFQNISYIVDVYKQKIAHAGNVLDFGFYTTFFPQLVAGPIIRADQFVPQLYKPFFLSRRQFGIAVFWILNGLIKKIVLSDYLAVNFVDRVFDHPTLYTSFENFAALFVYSLQVYADFSGYTDIAIGVAMLMGFYLPKNFNSPYKATNPAGFWKRWHMSLSNWLKDYLYIPLGGNRNGTIGSYLIVGGMLVVVALMAKTLWVTVAVTTIIGTLIAVYLLFPNFRKELNTNLNNFDTMLLGGMWHGASFNFITWGALNGMGILIYKTWKRQGPWTRIIVTAVVFAIFLVASLLAPAPALNLGAVWTGILFGGTLIRYIAYALRKEKGEVWSSKSKADSGWLITVWNTLMTFVFITFTRLFFRSGSNLNPSEANEVAWRTAREMVNQIGGHWNMEQIPAILSNYASVFVLFVLGMIIHWLPERFKRRYRLWFALMPLWMMAIVVVLSVFVVYQFITADLQPFIYFQF